MYNLRLCEDVDIANVDSFLAAIVFDEEPLISANRPVVIPPANESLSAVVIPQRHSVLAEDEDGHVIGVCLNDKPPQEFPSIYTNSDEDIKFQELFQYIENESKVMVKAPDALEVRLMCVDPRWRKKGVATELLATTEESARQFGYNWLKIYCTSYYSNKLMVKLGWKLLYSLSYEEYINNFRSNIKLPNKPHTHCNLYLKKII